MKSFLHKLRRGIILQNKFNRYLLYAIGEIVLVVIGILIALQINTWNNQRENNTKEKEYLVLLTQELRTELDYLRELKEEFRITETSLRRLRDNWLAEKHVVKDSVQYLKDYAAIGFINPWYSEPVTWSLLQRTGDLALIKDNDLKNELFLYYSELKKTADNYLEFPMEMVKMSRKDMDSPFISDGRSMDFINPLIINQNLALDTHEVSQHPKLFNKIWDHRKKLIHNAVIMANIAAAQQILLSRVINQGELLLQNLEVFQREAGE